LADDWDELDKVMTQENVTLTTLSTILPDVNEALADMLNLGEEEFKLLPPTFAKDHWKLIQDVV
jgi:hypothetical protein